MDEETKFWIETWSIAGVVACVITLTVGFVNWRTNIAALENGYEETVLPGSASVVWVKAK